MSAESIKLTDPHDHPEPHTMKWTQAEMDYINNRVETAVRQAIEQAQKQAQTSCYCPNCEALSKQLEQAQKQEPVTADEKLARMKSELAYMRQAQKQEPVAVHQFRNPHCSDWYDGIPDHHDGHGPYEVRTLYTSPQCQPLKLEAVYETIIHWDEGGGKRSRRELARRIVELAAQQRQPLTDDEIWKDDGIMAANSGYGATFDTLREVVRAIEAAHGIKE